MTDTDLVKMKFYSPIKLEDLYQLIIEAGDGAFTNESVYRKYVVIAEAGRRLPTSKKMLSIALKKFGIKLIKNNSHSGWLFEPEDITRAREELNKLQPFKELPGPTTNTTTATTTTEKPKVVRYKSLSDKALGDPNNIIPVE